MVDTAVKEYSFSIVIPCRNESKYIENCLKSILNQNYNQKLIEIIIVDGFSSDGTREIINDLMRDHSNIILLDNPEKKTPHALNIGVRKASGEIIVILGAHTEINEDFISYNNFYQNTKNVQVTGGTQKNVGISRVQKMIGFIMELPFAMASAKYRWSDKEQFVDTVVYAAYRRELFEKLGYFEEKFTISEDAEFNWRIRKAGYKIFYSPKIKSNYYPRDSIFGFLKQIFRYGILRVNVIKKHTDSIKLFHLIPPFFVLIVISLLIMGFFNKIYSFYLIVFLALYFVVNFISTLSSIKGNKFYYILIVPWITFLMHMSWGLGFFIGYILPKSKNL